MITAQFGTVSEEPSAPDSAQQGQSDVRATLAREAPSILVVDDDDESRARLVAMLERIYRVRGASDASLALAMCASDRPDAILFNADRAEVGSRRLETLLRLAFGDVSPPVVVLADSANDSEAGGELLCREDDLPDAITLVSLLEQVLADAAPFDASGPKGPDGLDASGRKGDGGKAS